MQIRKCETQATISDAILLAQRGRYYHWMRTFAVQVDGRIYSVAMNIFERIWTLAAKALFGVDRIKKCLSAAGEQVEQPITFLYKQFAPDLDKQSTSDLDKQPAPALPPTSPPTSHAIRISKKTEKILSRGVFGSRNIRHALKAAELAEKIINDDEEYLCGKNPGRQCGTPPTEEEKKWLSEKCRFVSVGHLNHSKWNSDDSEFFLPSLVAALRYLLMEDKLSWFESHANGCFSVGLPDWREDLAIRKPRHPVTKELLEQQEEFIEQHTIVFGDLTPPSTVNTGALKKIVNGINSNLYHATINPKAIDTGFASLFLMPAKHAPELDFLVVMGLIHSWNINKQTKMHEVRLLEEHQPGNGPYTLNRWRTRELIQQYPNLLHQRG